MDNEKTCVNCGKALNWIKPGVSKKTGNPYNGFWACPDKHPQNNGATFAASTTAVASAEKETGDQKVWDAKDRQSMAQTAMKGATEITAALINAGLQNFSVAAVEDMTNKFYAHLKKLKSQV